MGGDAATLVKPAASTGRRTARARPGPPRRTPPACPSAVTCWSRKRNRPALDRREPGHRSPRRRFPTPRSRRSARKCSTCDVLSLGCAHQGCRGRAFRRPSRTPWPPAAGALGEDKIATIAAGQRPHPRGRCAASALTPRPSRRARCRRRMPPGFRHPYSHTGTRPWCYEPPMLVGNPLTFSNAVGLSTATLMRPSKKGQ
jgi:hypothetical protein